MEDQKETAVPEPVAVSTLAGTELDCSVASWLRFPLIAMVVLIHVTLFYWFSEDYAPWFKSVISWVSDVHRFPVALVLIQFVQEVLTRVALPLFLFIAGYFYFLNVDKLTSSIWIAKSKRRIFSLLIPYVVWNFLAMLQIYVRWLAAGDSGDLSAFLHWAVAFRGGDLTCFVGEGNPVAGLIAMTFAGTLMPGELFPRPLLEQFWFVRDLFLLSLLSPLAWWLFKRKWLGISALALLFLICIFWIDTGTTLLVNAKTLVFEFFFFGLGAFFSINKFCFSDICVPARWVTLLIYCVFAFVDFNWLVLGLSDLPLELRYFMRVVCIILGAMSFWGWVAKGLTNGKLVSHRFLAGASFFVFCSQSVGCRIFETTILRSLPKESDFEVILGFVFFTVFVLAFSITMFWILRRYAPIALVPLAGGRK